MKCSVLKCFVTIALFTTANCRPTENSFDNVTQILPISTFYHMLPTADGRNIPVKVIHFRKPEDETVGDPFASASQNIPVILPNSLMAPRGFRDDFDLKAKSNLRRIELENRFRMQIPIIPDNVSTPNWVPGELIVHEITRRQMKMIDQSQFGPLRSITFVPSVRTAIVIFEKRYHPAKLAQALKYLYGIDSEPNGTITVSE